MGGVGEPGPAREGPGGADLARLQPSPPRPIQPASSRAAALEAVTGWPSTRSISTPRQTEWLEIRRVPLTYQEWPLRRQETRIRWRAATATSSWRTRRSSRGEVQSAAGRHPAPLVKLSPVGARVASGGAGSWGVTPDSSGRRRLGGGG